MVSRAKGWAHQGWRWLRTPYGLIFIAYVVLRVIAFVGVGPTTFPDTASYKAAAHQSLFSIDDFWFGRRPWTVPLLYKVFSTDTLRVCAQLVISITCWTALAWQVAAWIRVRWLGIASFAAVLAFASSSWIVQWDPVLLTESVSLSLGAAAVATWLAFYRRPSWVTAAILVVVAVFWTFSRDTNGYLVLLVIPFVAIWWRWSPRPAVNVTAALALAAVFGAFVLATNSDGGTWRRVTPLLNVIGRRILTNTDATAYFRAHGMPYGPSVAKLAGTSAGIEGPQPDTPPTVWSVPQLRPFTDWVTNSGQSTYVGYLVSHPFNTAADVVRYRDVLLSATPKLRLEGVPPLTYYAPPDFRPAIPNGPQDVIYPPSVTDLAFEAVLVGILAVVVLLRGGFRRNWVIPLFILVISFPHLALIWHGDPGEITRHALIAAVLVRIGILLLLAFALDSALVPRKRDRSMPRRQRDGLAQRRRDTALT